MKRLVQLFAIRPDEVGLASLLIVLMSITAVGNSLGVSGIETLFFARFGVTYLPLIYMIQGVLTLVVTLTVSALLGGRSRNLIYILMPVIMALILLAERFLVGFTWFLPILWLIKEVLNSLMGLYVWGVASMLCDARQAKRLFPLFSAGRILGAVLGGLSTGPLVSLIGAENLLVVWAITLGLAFLVTRALLGRGIRLMSQPTKRTARARRSATFIQEVQQGFQFVRGSALMRWISLAAVLFSALYFSVALPFSKAATTQFLDEASLAGFLGLFNALSTAAAFLASLFIANRLYARFGVMNAILALPIIYVVGFGVLALFDLFPVLVVYKFIQMLWLAGIADSAYQAMFNAVPGERRDQVRAFIGGVPEQAGTFIAGFILIVGEGFLQPQQFYLIGLGLGLACTYVIWRAGRAYSGALVTALRAGQPQLFIGSDPLRNIQQDATAVSVAVAGLSNPDPTLRRVSAEIVGGLSSPQAAPALVTALADSDVQVRVAALRGLTQARAVSALLDIAARLRDEEPEVRAQAIEAMGSLAGFPTGLRLHIEPLLGDPVSTVRARAAVVLLRSGGHPEAARLLRAMAVLGGNDERAVALTALGDWGDGEALALIENEIQDTTAPAPVLRAAARALAACGIGAVPSLVAALSAGDRSVREAVAESLGQLGLPAAEPTAAALFNPATEHGAIHALERLPVARVQGPLRRYAQAKVERAVHYQELYRAVKSPTVDFKYQLLCESLRDAARQQGLHALRAVNLLGDHESLGVVMENLNSRDPNQRATALETLESVHEAALVKPVLKVWEDEEQLSHPGAAPSVAQAGRSQTLARIFREPDAWLRACAALAAGGETQPGLLAELRQLAESDPDLLVRREAQAAIENQSPDSSERSPKSPDLGHSGLRRAGGGDPMDTLATLSLMERILFLKRVPLFADLPPADLKQVAAIASELLYIDGDVIAAQGDPGDEMFVIASGEVCVRVAAEGKPEVEVARRKTGDYVGEMAIISREPRIASLIAAGAVRTLCIDRKSFEGLLRERPEASLAMMRGLCARLKELSK